MANYRKLGPERMGALGVALIGRACLLLCVLPVVLLACDSPRVGPMQRSDTTAGVTFSVQDTSFKQGDTIAVVLKNESAYTLGYNLCLVDLERKENTGWKTVQRFPNDAACIAVLKALEPRTEANGYQIVYAFIQPGLYRFRGSVDLPVGGGRQVSIVSNSFRILDK
jgi:hypothetical protein